MRKKKKEMKMFKITFFSEKIVNIRQEKLLWFKFEFKNLMVVIFCGGWAIIFYFPERLEQSLWEIKNYCPPSSSSG